MTVYFNGALMRSNRPRVSTIVAPKYLPDFDLDRYIHEVNVSLANTPHDDAPKIKDFLVFLQQLKKSFRWCSFAIAAPTLYAQRLAKETQGAMDAYKASAHLIRSPYTMAPKILVYLPSNRYVSGWVSLGDFRMGDSAPIPKIAVWSPHITNGSTGNDNMQHSLKVSTKVKTAISTAKRYFKDENMGEIARSLSNEPSHAVASYDRDLAQLVAEAKKSLCTDAAFPAAMAQLAASGYTFTDLGLKEKLQTYITEMEYQAENSTGGNPELMYIRGYVKGGVQMFDRVKRPFGYGYGSHNDKSEVLGTCREEDLSEDIKRKLSTLMMGEDMSFVAGAGYKLDEEIYYVYT